MCEKEEKIKKYKTIFGITMKEEKKEYHREKFSPENMYIYVDGSYRNKNKHQSAIIIYYNGIKEKYIVRHLTKSGKSTEAEMKAVIAAVLMAVKRGVGRVYIYTDSWECINKALFESKCYSNLDLEYFRCIEWAKEYCDLKIVKVKGHSKNIYHNEVDRLASGRRA